MRPGGRVGRGRNAWSNQSAGDNPLLFWLGLTTLRNGHGWLFFGIFFPILWIVGAFMAPTASATGGPVDGTGA